MKVSSRWHSHLEPRRELRLQGGQFRCLRRRHHSPRKQCALPMFPRPGTRTMEYVPIATSSDTAPDRRQEIRAEAGHPPDPGRGAGLPASRLQFRGVCAVRACHARPRSLWSPASELGVAFVTRRKQCTGCTLPVVLTWNRLLGGTTTDHGPALAVHPNGNVGREGALDAPRPSQCVRERPPPYLSASAAWINIHPCVVDFSSASGVA